jgi:cell division protein FtsL
MKKFSVIFLILFLILFTAIIKNSTKRIDDEIFSTKENIRGLKKNFENIKLEYDYLSSADRLLEFHKLYFDEELFKKNIENFMIIKERKNSLKIKQLKF